MAERASRRITNVELLNRLRDVLGGRRVSRSKLDQINYSRDLWPRSLLDIRRGRIDHLPELIVWPETTDEVSKILKICNDMKVPLVPFGAGSGLCGGAQPLRGGVVLDTKRMNRVERISEPSLLVVSQAGILGAHLEQELNRRGYTMGHFPGSLYTSTLGGYLATRSAGMSATRYGKIEDMVVSFQAVLADGTVIHTRTAPRRATGPDFNHLLLGSEGTLAVFTSAHMRIHLLPESRLFLSLSFAKLPPALETVRKIMRAGLRPAVVRLSDETDTSLTMNTLGLETEGCLLLLILDGRETRLEIESRKAMEIARAEGGRDLGEEPARHWYSHRLAELYRQSPIFNTQKMFMDTIEVAATWSNALPVYQQVRAALGKQVTVMSHVAHAYPEGCSLHFTVWGKAKKESDLKLYEKVWEKAMAATIASGGVISHAFGIGQSKAKWLAVQNPAAVQILQGVKRRLDPNNILNPGKLALNAEGAC